MKVTNRICVVGCILVSFSLICLLDCNQLRIARCNRSIIPSHKQSIFNLEMRDHFFMSLTALLMAPLFFFFFFHPPNLSPFQSGYLQPSQNRIILSVCETQPWRISSASLPLPFISVSLNPLKMAGVLFRRAPLIANGHGRLSVLSRTKTLLLLGPLSAESNNKMQNNT